MIDKTSKEYIGVARYGDPGWVKITHFTEPPYNFDIKGVIHVGANDGYEAEIYHKMGIENILLFEPLPSAFEKLDQKKFYCFNLALGAKDQWGCALHITPGDGKGSTFLTPVVPEEFIDTIPVSIARFDSLVEYGRITLQNPVIPSKYDCLVIDVQGMELDVLIGFGKYLDCINFINVECSETPIYVGEATAEHVENFLDSRGFKRVIPISAHDDVLYIRKSLL